MANNQTTDTRCDAQLTLGVTHRQSMPYNKSDTFRADQFLNNFTWRFNEYI